MANLGYWQMKVSPGVWYLQLAPGRSSELYNLKDEGDGNSLKRIMINDMRGKVVQLEVMKKKGKEHEKLLVSTDDDQSEEAKVGHFLLMFYLGYMLMHQAFSDDVALFFQGSGKSWNSNILKWASGLMGGNDKARKGGNTSVVSAH